MRPTAAQTAGAARLPGLLQLAGSVQPPDQAMGIYVSEDLNTQTGEISLNRGNQAIRLQCRSDI
jgi:hypothetical protein